MCDRGSIAPAVSPMTRPGPFTRMLGREPASPEDTESGRTNENQDVVPFRDAVRVWLAISLQTFGGPAGQIAVMQRSLVEEKRWIGQRRFLHALSYCTLLPGPEAQQLAIYVG
jgi:chromate transporter